ncbi:hypothetical protein OF83DRAFT_1086747 [Amylostereum chailletii]|nr:hypothetical protein OF83DRAFT_1086747 [Amylostereum chailletii]
MRGRERKTNAGNKLEQVTPDYDMKPSHARSQEMPKLIVSNDDQIHSMHHSSQITLFADELRSGKDHSASTRRGQEAVFTSSACGSYINRSRRQSVHHPPPPTTTGLPASSSLTTTTTTTACRAPSTPTPSKLPILILRSKNWQHLRPEKAWRPIVTLDVDGGPAHELCLGSDGQNPNLRVPMFLHDAHEGSQLNVALWYKGASKAKSKKRRQQVAHATVRLGEAYSKQGNERLLDLRLAALSAVRRKSVSPKNQPSTSLVVRLRPPLSSASSSSTLVDDDTLSQSLDSFAHSLSDTDTDPSSSASELEDPPPENVLRRRKRVKGFCVDSDDDALSCYLSSGPSSPLSAKPSEHWPPLPDIPWYEDGVGFVLPTRPAIVCPPSVLPSAHLPDTASISSTVSLASSAFDTFTYYRELREACVDSDREALLKRLLHEWYYIGASLLSISALGTTVFGFSPDSIFGVDTLAKRALTLSTISAALGLAIDAWFIFLYSGADALKFQTLALDIYNGYFFFALTSRVPLLALLLAALSLALFLVSVAWTAWPSAVLVLSFLAGMLVCLQFLVYGVQQAALAIARGVRALWTGARFVGWRLRVLCGGARDERGTEEAVGRVETAPGAVVGMPAGVAAVPMRGM